MPSQAQAACHGGGGGGNGRTKRMRTSFKHHQLRTMKQYFALNQNPDAKVRVVLLLEPRDHY